MQIQGKAPIPAPFSDQKNDYLSLLERRNLCEKDAIMKSHAKWLSLTLEDRQDPAEWQKRLEMGAIGPWTSCLQKAEILTRFYDDIQTCRVVLRYHCHPSHY